jgi:DNA helicase-2/ATP-dependent DNA helicase PcrA
LQQFAELVTRLQQLATHATVAEVIKAVLAGTKLREYWDQEGTLEGQTRYENVLELVSVASKYDHITDGTGLTTFLEEVALLTDADRTETAEDAITLMTLHAAKGLEFPVVFLVGLEQNIFPSSRTLLEPRQLEEERRLFYVGLTRAGQRLYLTHARQRLFFGEIQVNAPSQFLADLPPETLAPESDTELYRRGTGATEISSEAPASRGPSLATGDGVRHPVFGTGLVVAVRGGVVEVNFGKAGIKKLALSIAPLEKL